MNALEAIKQSERQNEIVTIKARNSANMAILLAELIDAGYEHGLEVDYASNGPELVEAWAYEPDADDSDESVWRVHIEIE